MPSFNFDTKDMHDDEWNYYDDIFFTDGSYDGPGGEICINDPENNAEEEYIEIGNVIDHGGESPDITIFHNGKYDPNYI